MYLHSFQPLPTEVSFQMDWYFGNWQNDLIVSGLYKVYISDFETSQSGSIFSWADQWNVIEIENQQTFKSYSLKILPCRYHYWETNVLYYQYRHRQKYCITIVITFCVTFVTGTATNKYSCKIDIVVWLFYFKLNNNC